MVTIFSLFVFVCGGDFTQIEGSRCQRKHLFVFFYVLNCKLYLLFLFFFLSCESYGLCSCAVVLLRVSFISMYYLLLGF